MNFKREGNTVEVLKQSFRADLKRKIGSWKAEMREQENYLSSTSCFWPHFCFCPTCVTCVCAYTYWSYSVSVHRSVRRLWVMLMSGSRVVISEPQAGRPEAAEQLVIWCGLRYRSLGVKLCASERRADMQQPPVCRRRWDFGVSFPGKWTERATASDMM